ncbi:MAG: AF1514 family protein [Sulfuricella sp.]|nr:AF1514 family protein [Sulfuricella sp.]
MKTAHINYTGMDLDYETARSMAVMFAEKDGDISEPVMVAWNDSKTSMRSPVLEDCAVETSWRDYGISHSGKLEVNVNDEYDFIFADSGDFDMYGPSPYINMHDLNGKEYLCLASALRNPHPLHNPHNPSKEACVPLDEWTSKLT